MLCMGDAHVLLSPAGTAPMLVPLQDRRPRHRACFVEGAVAGDTWLCCGAQLAVLAHRSGAPGAKGLQRVQLKVVDVPGAAVVSSKIGVQTPLGPNQQLQLWVEPNVMLHGAANASTWSIRPL